MIRNRYKTPRNQTERLKEAEAAIARLELTLRQGDNRFGSYGDNCRDSLKRWKIVAEDATMRIARGELKL